MTTKATQGVTHQAAAVRAGRVEGPLKGYHHEAYAVRLDQGSPLARDFHWLKLREPRQGVLWYDMRWFRSEDELLRLLHREYGPKVPRVPRVGEQIVNGQPFTFLAFIEGVTLDRVRGSRPGRVSDRHLAQIEELFCFLAAVDADAVAAHGGPSDAPAADGTPPEAGCRRYDLGAYPRRGGSTAFLRALTHFTLAHAYRDRHKDMEDLLDRLGAPADALDAFGRREHHLTDRPRTLLHGDLHRRNLIVDRAGDLWTIDWELALVGDPLYDLATHLHLMGYQDDQEREVVARWRRAVGRRRSAGAHEDLPHYRAYKRVQSLCTDVVRATTRLKEGGPPGGADARARLRGAATIVRRALAAAGEPLLLPEPPPMEHVEAVLADWWHRNPSSD